MKTLFAFASALLVGATFAAGPRAGIRPGAGPRFGMMEGPNDPIVRLIRNPQVVKELGLTEEQKAKIEEINKSALDPALTKDLRAAMRKQTELLQAEKIDEAAVMAEIDKAFEIRKEVAKRQTKRIIAIKSVLTSEQIQKALEMAKAKAAARRAHLQESRKAPPPDGPKPAPAKD